MVEATTTIAIKPYLIEDGEENIRRTSTASRMLRDNPLHVLGVASLAME